MQRSAAIRKIEQDLIELSHLYNEVAELVHQQEPAVQQIQQGAEETHRNVEQANTKLDTAIQSAKNARRWKWYALIIVSEYLPVCTPRSGQPANLVIQSLLLLLSSLWPSLSPRPTRTNSDLSVAPRPLLIFSMYDFSRGSTHLRIFPFVLCPLVIPPIRISFLCKSNLFQTLFSLSLCLLAVPACSCTAAPRLTCDGP